MGTEPDGETIRTVRNKHPGADEPAPDLDDDRYMYVGIYENKYREQMVFAINKETDEVELYHGDAGWAQHTIPLEEFREEPVEELVLNRPWTLNEAERKWLEAMCLTAKQRVSVAPA